MAGRDQALLEACRVGQCTEIRKLVKAGASLEGRDREGYGPLHLAILGGGVGEGSVAAVKALLALGAPVDARSRAGLTPLMLAAMGAKPDDWDGEEAFTGLAGAVQALLAAGADPRAVDAEGFTALHYAALTGADHPVRLLLAAGAPRDMNNRHGQSPLDLARDMGHEDVIDSLDMPAATRKRTSGGARPAARAAPPPAVPKRSPPAPAAYRRAAAGELGARKALDAADRLVAGFAPEGDRVFLADRLHLWGAALDGRLVVEGTTKDGEAPTDIVVAPGGRNAATWFGFEIGGRRVTLWRLDGGTAKACRPKLPFPMLLGFLFLGEDCGMAFGTDGDGHGTCALVSLESGAVERKFPANSLNHVLPLPDGSILTIRDVGRNEWITETAARDPGTGKERWRRTFKTKNRAAAVGPGGRILYLADEGSEHNFLALVDLSSGAVIRQVPSTDECPQRITVSLAGDRVLVTPKYGSAGLWTGDGKKRLAEFDDAECLLVPTGNAVVSTGVAGRKQQFVVLDALQPDRVLAECCAKPEHSACAASRNGAVALACQERGRLKLEIWLPQG